MSESARAELGSTAEAVAGYKRRLAVLAATVDDGRNDDLVAAIFEAERNLGVAERTVRRAHKIAGGAG